MTAGIVECPRVIFRMECPECNYPYSEAKYPLDKRLPHLLTECEDIILEEVILYELLLESEEKMFKFRVAIVITSILFIIFGFLIPTLFADAFVQGLIAVTWMVAGIVLMLLIFLVFVILD